jgi:hypothetical protein
MREKDGPLMKASDKNRRIAAQYFINHAERQKSGWEINTFTTGDVEEFWPGGPHWVSS